MTIDQIKTQTYIEALSELRRVLQTIHDKNERKLKRSRARPSEIAMSLSDYTIQIAALDCAIETIKAAAEIA